MNKLIQATLGGVAFDFEHPAYQRLDHYLARLHGYFRSVGGEQEIMQDIEARLCELFLTQGRHQSVVRLQDVEGAIAVIGSYETLSGDRAEMPAANRFSYATGAGSELTTGKKLMRDPDDKVIAGVCSGIAAYFGIEDPIWVRLAFVISLLSFGFGVLPYLIMWILLPKATTPQDFQRMRGQSGSLESFGHQIGDELYRVGNDVDRAVRENYRKFSDRY